MLKAITGDAYGGNRSVREGASQCCLGLEVFELAHAFITFAPPRGPWIPGHTLRWVSICLKGLGVEGRRA